MKRMFTAAAAVATLLFTLPVGAYPRSGNSQSTANTCGKASASSSTATARSGHAGVGGRHSVGTNVGICVNGIQVGSGTSITVDQFGSSTAVTSTSADCLNSRKRVRQGAYSGVYGEGSGSAAAASSAACN